jgi:hypothetical protein
MGNGLSPRQFQRGYLLEIPIMLFLLLVVLALILPRLPLNGQKLLLAIALVPIVFGLFYMVVIPGWMPGSANWGRRVWRAALFLGGAAAIVAGVGAFILR